ncbi:MAG: ABC transporter ATP-binding protein [Deltaproteobacteria bacterium]|nr:ABC transporter ATP-binding protein [Deltaproteobacteria bacterium]
MAALVRGAGLVKRYADVLAVDHLDLEITAGECVGLLGPNGAGKTTTVEMLEGLTPPSEGVIELFGWRWGTRHDDEIRSRIGVQLQETQLTDKLTVEETLRLFRSFYRSGRTVAELINLLSLEEKRGAYVGRLSGGQRQRLALGCALVGAPDLLFLDEPTTGLDPQARRNVWDIVERFRAGGGTVCLTTHYMEEATRLCSRVAIIDHGRVIAQGAPAELVARLEAPELITLELTGEIEAPQLTLVPGVKSAERRPEGWVLHTAHASGVLPDLLRRLDSQRIEVRSVSTRQATLEDVFIHLTGRGLRDG